MICYRDMTFCTFHGECLNGPTCPRALTAEVLEDAVKWWGSDGTPIARFVEAPDCLEAEPVGIDALAEGLKALEGA
jgi:hypothetical protein